ncbi:MAG: tetratricopeptide repeat protein [Cyclobacteriaceae bacterium]|nr:tetratricopeptide repeat protein [Cyclobacteriaceae bacterium]
MKQLVLFILLSIFAVDINKIARVNKAKRQGESAYASGDYHSAIAAFRYLTDTLHVTEDPILLNLANAYYNISDTTSAEQYYSQITRSTDPEMRSLAHLQLGVIHQQKNKLKEAIAEFKASLMSDPQNEDARYNYELLKKILAEQEKSEQDQDENIEPSEYARQLKAQADEMVKQNLFANALELLKAGLQKDKTVAAYNQFMNKLNDVVQSKEQP